MIVEIKSFLLLLFFLFEAESSTAPCPVGWDYRRFLKKEKCYKKVPVESGNKTVAVEENYCRKAHPSAHLAAIAGVEEDLILCAKYKNSVIGYHVPSNKNYHLDHFQWENGANTTYTGWEFAYRHEKPVPGKGAKNVALSFGGVLGWKEVEPAEVDSVLCQLPTHLKPPPPPKFCPPEFVKSADCGQKTCRRPVVIPEEIDLEKEGVTDEYCETFVANSTSKKIGCNSTEPLVVKKTDSREITCLSRQFDTQAEANKIPTTAFKCPTGWIASREYPRKGCYKRIQIPSGLTENQKERICALIEPTAQVVSGAYHKCLGYRTDTVPELLEQKDNSSSLVCRTTSSIRDFHGVLKYQIRVKNGQANVKLFEKLSL